MVPMCAVHQNGWNRPHFYLQPCQQYEQHQPSQFLLFLWTSLFRNRSTLCCASMLFPVLEHVCMYFLKYYYWVLPVVFCFLGLHFSKRKILLIMMLHFRNPRIYHQFSDLNLLFPASVQKYCLILNLCNFNC